MLAAAGLTCAVLLAACGGGDDDEAADRSTTTEEPTTTTTVDTTGFDAFDWLAPQPIAIGNDWTIADCEGDGPLLCLTHEDGRYAKVEYLRFVSPAGTDVDAHAQRFFEDFTTDRRQGCGEGYQMVQEPVLHLESKDGPVVRYGFSGGFGGSAGSITERTIQWAGARGDGLVLVTLSAYDPGACISPEGEGTLDSLEEVLPGLSALVEKAGLPLI